MACSPATILKEDVAPFVDRRELADVAYCLASSLTHLHLADRRLKRCRFRAADGAMLRSHLPVTYAPVPIRQYFAMDRCASLRRLAQQCIHTARRRVVDQGPQF